MSQQVISRIKPLGKKAFNEFDLDLNIELNISKTPTKIAQNDITIEEAKKVVGDCGLKTNGVSKTTIMRLFKELEEYKVRGTIPVYLS